MRVFAVTSLQPFDPRVPSIPAKLMVAASDSLQMLPCSRCVLIGFLLPAKCDHTQAPPEHERAGPTFFAIYRTALLPGLKFRVERL